ncbi:MAG TPA: hypothetical protein DDY13_20205 [Cytophagales bacterium]|jgi:hypothetical protein|nr:hypothetical protein [Cytophagales bacterium]
MFGFFKRNKSKSRGGGLQLKDLHHQVIQEGDLVQAYRYNLGRCIVIRENEGIAYKSLEIDKVVSWPYMIDASTELQKVERLENGSDK